MTDARARWNARYRNRGRVDAEASLFLVAHAHLLPTTGSAIDIGGGAGRNAVWLAERGLDVTVVDVSSVGLDRARSAADGAGVSLCTVERDVEADGLPEGPWDVALMHLFWHRAVLDGAVEHLASGGLVMVCQPTMHNRERHERPGERFLLEPGEVVSVAAQLERQYGMTILEASEGWRPSGRHDAWLVARAAP